MRLNRTLPFGFLCALATTTMACPASLDGRCSENACDASAALVSDSSADVGPDGSVDPCVDDPAGSNCKDNAAALFVSASSGSDSNAGTKEAPLLTIAAALTKLTPERHRIYVCEGSYAEDVSLTTAHNGLTLLGGVRCDWTDAQVKPTIGATSTPLRIEATSMVSIADMAFEAKDAQSGSSIAALLLGADVVFKRVRLVAGAGAQGQNGVLVPYLNFPSQIDLNGKAAPADGSNNGGDQNSVTCPGGKVTVGGKGGNKGESGVAGTPGPTNAGTLSNCGDFRDGIAGTTPIGGNGASIAGRLAADGWEPQSGDDGEPGNPGQGGGGGYGNNGGGGGGGAGGCGGAGGAGGKGGGASIALVASGGRVTISGGAQLIARGGGAGGDGVAGQAPQTQTGFRGGATGNACQGGAGGMGATGAPGGGGAGGVSAGVIYKGSQPTIDADTDIQIGQAGHGGKGGAMSGKDGITPDAQRTLESP